MHAHVDEWRRRGDSIGFVPTMGALHQGHLALVRRARAENERVVVSVFVNPLQFGPHEDFDRYPRNLDADLQLLAGEGVDLVFAPGVRVMYPEGASTRVEVAGIGEVLEGVSRPGFFNGVATVVTKLFNIVKPDRAYFGSKDAQQVAVVKRLARDLDTGVEVRAVPTVREPDGLALSSRNSYLDRVERQAATCLVKALRSADRAYREGVHEPQKLKAALTATLGAEPLARVDYAEVVDAESFGPPTVATLPLRAVLAVWIGRTRLIDNHVLGEPM